MNERGLIFYKKISPYPGDYTKNATLCPSDADNNFFNLKSADIKSMEWDDNQKVLSLTRMDGEVLSVDNIISDENYDFDYNSDLGELTIVINDTEYVISGFTTKNDLNSLSVDYTLEGNGSPTNPLKESNLVRTGYYRPVKSFIDTSNGGSLPNNTSLNKGDRYITKELVNDYGLLYNFNAVQHIASDLKCQNSEWRIPTKSDWDTMLDAIEPNAEFKNHTNASSNRALGQFAGKYLKSVNDWMLESSVPTPPCPTPTPPCPTPTPPCGCDCSITTCGGCDINPTPNRGTDKYGFTALPSGYGDGGVAMDYFKFRGVFWTSTMVNTSDIYVKRFDYNTSTVYQETAGPYYLFSLRLVKDYDGQNFNERETINGVNFNTVLMPSSDGVMKVWTQVNVNFTDTKYCGVEPNGGIGIVKTPKFFINEWNGCTWKRVEMVEGDNVIINISPDSSLNTEWRLISDNGTLILTKTESSTFALEAKLDAEIERAINSENEIITKFNDYTTTSELLTLLQGVKDVVVNTITPSSTSIVIGGTTTNPTIGLQIDNTVTKGNVELSETPNGLIGNVELPDDLITESELTTALNDYYTKTEVDNLVSGTTPDISSTSNAIEVTKTDDNFVLDFKIDTTASTGNVLLTVTDNGIVGNINTSDLATKAELDVRFNALDTKIIAETGRATAAEVNLGDRIDAIELEVDEIQNRIEAIGDFGEY